MQIRPYGDTANDGIVQISFTLPLDFRACETARWMTWYMPPWISLR
jgi:hypothetical protein